MEQNFKYEKEDWIKFQSFLEKDICRSTKLWYERAWFNFILWLVIAFVFFVYFQSSNEFSWTTAGIVSFFFIFILAQTILTGVKFKKLCGPSEEGSFIGEHSFEFDDEAIHTEGKGYKASHSWSVVKRLAKTDEVVYLFLDNAYAYIFPLSQVSDPEGFLSYLESKLNVTRSST